MSTPFVTSASTVGGSSTSSTTNPNAGLDNVDINQFLQMMITELHNQDPLNPMQNSEIMQELGQMQQITASNKLTSTLDGIALGQSLSNATTLIGKQIDGLDDDGNPVSGVVQRVSVLNNTPKLYVGAQVVSLDNVQDVLPN